MKDKLSLVVGMLAGALAMDYLDPQAGRRRRALPAPVQAPVQAPAPPLQPSPGGTPWH